LPNYGIIRPKLAEKEHNFSANFQGFIRKVDIGQRSFKISTFPQRLPFNNRSS